MKQLDGIVKHCCCILDGSKKGLMSTAEFEDAYNAIKARILLV